MEGDRAVERAAHLAQFRRVTVAAFQVGARARRMTLR